MIQHPFVAGKRGAGLRAQLTEICQHKTHADQAAVRLLERQGELLDADPTLFGESFNVLGAGENCVPHSAI